MEAAEKLKLTAENLNSMLSTSLRKISDTRKRTKKLKAVSILRARRKKKETKLEIPSEFKKSTKRIGNILPKGMGQGLMTSIVELVGFLLVGVAINNIEELKTKIDEIKSGFTKNVKFLKGIVENVYNGTRGFIGLFESEDRDKQLKDTEEQTKKLKEINKDKIDLEKISKNVQSEYEKVQKRFSINQNQLKDSFKLKKSGKLSSGEKFEVIKEDGVTKLKVIKENGEEKIYSMDDFQKEYKEEMFTNVLDLKNTNDISQFTSDFKFDSLISDLDLSSSLDNEEIENLTYVILETRK